MRALRAGFFFLIAIAIGAVGSGCVSTRERRHATDRAGSAVRVPGPIGEESLEPVPRPRIDVLELHQIDSGDPGYESVMGTIVNSGDKDTTTLDVSVYALDQNDRILMRAPGVPESERLRAAGGTTRFTATFARRVETYGYKVEAVAR
jgi:hypothetical protein